VKERLCGRIDEDTRSGLSLVLLAIAQNRADDVADLVISLSLTGVEADQPTPSPERSTRRWTRWRCSRTRR
jgi:hypothetical protein